MSARLQLARLMQSTGATEALLRLRARTRSPWLTVLTYHSVRADEPRLFDDGVVDATPQDFERQMAAVARYCKVVGVDELCRYADGAELPPNAVAITFDDGYRDNYELVLPILQRHGLKAIFFIATQFISERRVFWWDRASYLLKSSARDFIELRYPALLQVKLEGQRRREAIRAVLRLVKDFYDVDLERFLAELAESCGVEWNDGIDRAHAATLLMSWDQIRGLRRAGMDVQSHTRTHRVLQTLPEARLDEELGGSREELEALLGERVRAVSYPVGHTIVDRPRLRDAVRRAGYDLGFSNSTGVNPFWRPLDRFDIKRLAVDYQIPHALFRGMLAVPYLAV